MTATVIELGLALIAIIAAGLILIRIWDNHRETGRKRR
jgi:hypothetical protein